MAGGEINYDKTTEVIIRDIRTKSSARFLLKSRRICKKARF